MNLQQAKEFAQEKIAAGFKPNGCTFAPDLNIKECCDMHDTLLRFLKEADISRHRADELFYEYMLENGRDFIAGLYWLFVRFQAAIGSTFGLVILFVFIVGVSLMFWLDAGSSGT